MISLSVAYGVTFTNIIGLGGINGTDYDRFKHVRTFMHLFGDYSIAFDNDDTSSMFNTERHDDDWREAVVLVLMLIYLFFTNIVILKLIIASFTNKYTEIAKVGKRRHRFYLYEIIVECSKISILPFAFCLIDHFFLLMCHCMCRSPPAWYRRIYMWYESQWGLRSDITEEERLELAQLEWESADRVYKEHMVIANGKVTIKDCNDAKSVGE